MGSSLHPGLDRPTQCRTRDMQMRTASPGLASELLPKGSAGGGPEELRAPSLQKGATSLASTHFENKPICGRNKIAKNPSEALRQWAQEAQAGV